MALVAVFEAVRGDKGDENVPSAFGCCQALVVVSHSAGVDQQVTLGQVSDRTVVPVVRKK